MGTTCTGTVHLMLVSNHFGFRHFAQLASKQISKRKADRVKTDCDCKYGADVVIAGCIKKRVVLQHLACLDQQAWMPPKMFRQFPLPNVSSLKL